MRELLRKMLSQRGSIEVEPRSLYVTEEYTATLTIGIREVKLGDRTLDIDLLGRVLDQGQSQLSIFPGGDLRQSKRWLPDSRGERHRYGVFTVTKQIRAEEVGAVHVGPVFLKANYPTRVRRGFFGRYEVTSARRETARADAVTVEVKGPPEEGRPADYTGAIGRFAGYSPGTCSGKSLRLATTVPSATASASSPKIR